MPIKATSNLRFTDSHCHLDFDAFKNDTRLLLQQCHNAHIHNIIIPTIGPSNWIKTLEFTNTFSSEKVALHPCLGIHPWFLNDLPIPLQSCLDNLEVLLVQHLAQWLAIGEAGIDGVIAKEHNNLAQQLMVFERQLQLAEKYDLPIIVHHRRSHQHLVPLLKKYKLNKGGVIHAFSGSYPQACQYIDLGFKLGIGGTITYPRAEKTIKTVKRLPKTSLLLETDAPSMPLYGFQGQDNSPLRLIDIFNALVAIRSESDTELAITLEQNIQSLFPKSVKL